MGDRTPKKSGHYPPGFNTGSNPNTESPYEVNKHVKTEGAPYGKMDPGITESRAVTEDFSGRDVQDFETALARHLWPKDSAPPKYVGEIKASFSSILALGNNLPSTGDNNASPMEEEKREDSDVYPKDIYLDDPDIDNLHEFEDEEEYEEEYEDEYEDESEEDDVSGNEAKSQLDPLGEDILPLSGETELEAEEGDGIGGQAEEPDEEFVPLEKTHMITVEARFKNGKLRTTEPEYYTLLGGKKKRRPTSRSKASKKSSTGPSTTNTTQIPFHLLLYHKKGANQDLTFYVRVKERLYMTLDDLESRLVAVGDTDDEKDGALLQIYGGDWTIADERAKKKSTEKHEDTVAEGANRSANTSNGGNLGTKTDKAPAPKTFILWNHHGNPVTEDPAVGMVVPYSRPSYKPDLASLGRLSKKIAPSSTEERKKLGVRNRALHQFTKWKGIAEFACLPLKALYNPSARFWDPSPSYNREKYRLPLRFECSPQVSKIALASLLHVAVSRCNIRPVIQIVDKDMGADDEYFLLSSHLLNFYRTYTTKEGLVTLRALGQHKLPRPFPTPRQIKEVGKLIKIPPPPTLQNTTTPISVIRMNAYLKKARSESQQQLMKISATALAQKFNWPPNRPKDLVEGTGMVIEETKTNDESPKDLKNWHGQAEWLHRSAHSYGRFQYGESSQTNKPQKKENFIFGTKETNTFMMRPEASVKNIARMRAYKVSDAAQGWANGKGPVIFDDLSEPNIGYSRSEIPKANVAPDSLEKAKLEKEARKIRADVTCWVDTSFDSLQNASANAGKLSDVNWTDQTSSSAETQISDETGDPDDRAIPPKLRQQFLREQDKNKFWFLTDYLVYDVRIDDPQSGPSVNKRFILDTFSRFIPLKLEAELDKLVETAFYASHRLPDFEACKDASITIK